MNNLQVVDIRRSKINLVYSILQKINPKVASWVNERSAEYIVDEIRDLEDEARIKQFEEYSELEVINRYQEKEQECL